MIKRHWITASLIFFCLSGLPVQGQVEDTIKVLTPETKFSKEAMVVTALAEIGEAWRPWRAVAARILWHYYLNTKRRKRKDATA